MFYIRGTTSDHHCHAVTTEGIHQELCEQTVTERNVSTDRTTTLADVAEKTDHGAESEQRFVDTDTKKEAKKSQSIDEYSLMQHSSLSSFDRVCSCPVHLRCRFLECFGAAALGMLQILRTGQIDETQLRGRGKAANTYAHTQHAAKNQSETNTKRHS